MVPSFDVAKRIEKACNDNSVKLFIDKNFHWQAPVRALKAALESGVMGSLSKQE